MRKLIAQLLWAVILGLLMRLCNLCLLLDSLSENLSAVKLPSFDMSILMLSYA